MTRRLTWAFVICGAVIGCAAPAGAAGYTVVGWNNLGMHCTDADFSVLSLLPPYNTIHAQVIDPAGLRVKDPVAAGITVTYEAILDSTGSINTTSQGKTNFWQYVLPLFGVAPSVDVGLTGLRMPGVGNAPQPMTWDPAAGWFIAEGIPIVPYDDAHQKNPYPMMRLVARTTAGAMLAFTDIVLPVSDEMDCRSCHTSAAGTPAPAMPAGGWMTDPDPQREMRLNIVRKHDDLQAADPTFTAALAAVGYNSAGLYATVTTDAKPILCAICHASAALGTSGQTGVKALTQAVHGRHAGVTDPVTGQTLDSTADRSACYRCHPGSVTRCLRGVMGASVAPGGSLAIQCQDCHGPMSSVGASTRLGWLNEPLCQSCHTGTATNNSGELRYTSVFDTPGHVRQAVDQTFATTLDAPAPGLSLYRFSTGHGGLKCEACHGSTHAEFASTHDNDNVQSIERQGHPGMLVECGTCHGSTQPATVNGGPHGMHPVGQAWVNAHPDAVGEGGNVAQCQACHGVEYRGTVLSRSKADRTLSAFGGKLFWRGFQIGCYTCHLGPSNDDGNPNRPAVVTDASISTALDTPASVSLQATDPDGNPLALRIVSQPANGTVGLNGRVATYFPFAGFTGGDSFTFAAWDGSTDSNLGTVSVAVGGPTQTPMATPTQVPTETSTPTASQTPTGTPSNSASVTSTVTPTATNTYTMTPTATASETPNSTPNQTATATAAGKPTSETTTPTGTPTAVVASATPSPTAVLCTGDCNNDRSVTVDEILTMVNIALGNVSVAQCEPGDASKDGQITVDEILTAVNNALNGCAVSVPTATPTNPPITHMVTVALNGTRTFSPPDLIIQVGETVEWTWSSSGHDVVSGSGCTADGQFCSPNDSNCAQAPTSSQGAIYSHTFTVAGTYPYFCNVHCRFAMVGSITVQ